jgi:hypothetical protein
MALQGAARDHPHVRLGQGPGDLGSCPFRRLAFEDLGPLQDLRRSACGLSSDDEDQPGETLPPPRPQPTTKCRRGDLGTLPVRTDMIDAHQHPDQRAALAGALVPRRAIAEPSPVSFTLK